MTELCETNFDNINVILNCMTGLLHICYQEQKNQWAGTENLFKLNT